MAYDSENKIQFKSLAPSLQALLGGKGTNTLQTSFEKMVKDGSNGQIVKYNAANNNLYADDNMYLLRVSDSIEETTILKQMGPITLNDVYYKWNRISVAASLPNMGTVYKDHPENFNIYYNGSFIQGSNIGVGHSGDTIIAAYNAWTFNPNDNGIYNPYNYSPFVAAISDDKYDDYWIKIRTYANDGDDDEVGFIVAFMFDDDGMPHYIGLATVGNDSEYSGSGGKGWGFQMALVYDKWNSHNSYNADITYLARVCLEDPSKNLNGYGVNMRRFQRQGTSYIYVERHGTHIIAKATENNSTTYNMFIDYTLPKENPGYDTKTWNNIKEMLGGEATRVGFNTVSNCCYFWIDDQEHFFRDDKIYVVISGELWAYVNGQWVLVGNTADNIPHKVWLYNLDLNTVYWYDNPTTYYKLATDPTLIIPKNAGEIIKYNKFEKLHSETNFYKIPVVDNATDFAAQKAASNDSIYNLADGHIYIYDGTSWIKAGFISDIIGAHSWLYNERLSRYFMLGSVKPDKTVSYQRLILNK